MQHHLEACTDVSWRIEPDDRPACVEVLSDPGVRDAQRKVSELEPAELTDAEHRCAHAEVLDHPSVESR
jgi:hypothetical protein